MPTRVTIDQAQLVGMPLDLWRRAADLPNIHGDPMDRMLIAHAVEIGATVVSADEKIHLYPVSSVW
jgi:PIN domain nuclease of toxin-antitoxin system